MFNSKKGNYSHHLNNTTLPTLNDTCNGIPKITSTPLNPRHGQLSRRSSVLLSPTKSKLITPRRYSLSEINPPMNKSSLRMQETHSPGPLLASLSFKDNVSMYEETKSSGLARRIVLYNEETEQERQPTHQEKYHSPGLFPIVHLFKKKPPLLEQSPKRVKIKLSSPDYLKNYSPQHRSKLLEGLARPRLQNQHNLSSCSQKSSDTGTKSVLDALKEISRKRIHSNEECDLNEDSGKRLRTELHNGTTTASKRNRADSPLLDSSESPPPKQTQKKFCVYDEFAASKSSTDFSFLYKVEPTRSKRKTISTSTESLKETQQVKLINAETQTIVSSTESKTKSVQSDEYDSQNTKKKESPLKVFDDAPLDRIRKNRLAALMGNLAGKNAAILPKPNTGDNLPSASKELEEKEESMENPKKSEMIIVPAFSVPTEESRNETDLENKRLISILSPTKTTKEVSPVRSDKHVHFILPGTNSSSTYDQTLLTQTSASIVAPIVSASISSFSVSNNAARGTEVSSLVPFSSAELNSKSPSTPSTASSHSFIQNLRSSRSDIQISSAIGKSSSSSPLFSFPISLQPPKQDSFTVPKLTLEAPKTSSPQKLGGFKFELKTHGTPNLVSTTVGKSLTPTLTFSNPSFVSSTATTTLSGINSTTFTFSKPNDHKKESTFSFISTSSNSSTTSEPAFSLAGGITKSPTFISNTPESKLPSLNSTISGGFSFGSSGNAPMLGNLDSSGKFATFGTPTTSVTESLPFTTSTSTNYGAQTIHPNFSFARSTAATTTSGMFAFGSNTTVTSSSGFGSKPPPDFGANRTSEVSSSMFGNSGPAVMSGFGNNPTTTTSVFGSIATTTTPGFGNTSVTSFGSTPVASIATFGSTPNTSKSVFGTTPVTSTAVFGNTPAPSSVFGSTAPTSTSVFGSTNTSLAPGFGIAPSTTSSVFGTNNSTFGSNLTTTAPIFGTSNTKTPAFGSSSGFGTTNTQAPSFGNNTTPTFGNSSHPKPVFGPSTTTPNAPPPTFGSNTFGGPTTGTSTTTSAPAFGASNPNPTFSFGSNKPTSNVFGTVATTSSNTFGSNTFSSTSGFDQSTGFGNNTPAFGSAATPSNTFGATNTPAFGQVENKPAFAFGGSGENKSNAVFGSGAGNSAFGKPTNTQSGFRSSAPGFGATSTSGFNSQANGGFNFGSNAASSPAPFTFGSPSGNAEPPKPTFNFTGSTSNPPAFGSNNSTPGFGSNSSFGAPPFGATGTAAGVFNIGAGSNTGRPRTQLRAKRRT